MTLPEIVEQLRSCGYVCEAGPLENNVAFIELVRLAEGKERLALLRRLDDGPCRGGHVFNWVSNWVSSGTTFGGSPPAGTRCLCGQVEWGQGQ